MLYLNNIIFLQVNLLQLCSNHENFNELSIFKSKALTGFRFTCDKEVNVSVSRGVTGWTSLSPGPGPEPGPE